MLHTLQWVLLRITRLNWFDEDELEVSVDTAQIFEGQLELLDIDSSLGYEWDLLRVDALVCEIIEPFQTGEGRVLQFAAENDFHLSVYAYLFAVNGPVLIDPLLSPFSLQVLLLWDEVEEQVWDQIPLLLRKLDWSLYDY